MRRSPPRLRVTSSASQHKASTTTGQWNLGLAFCPVRFFEPEFQGPSLLPVRLDDGLTRSRL